MKRAHAGIPVAMLPEILDEARRLYEGGLSFRAVARQLIDRTGYRNVKSMSTCLHVLAHRHGWQVRDRVAAVVMASLTHGQSRGHRRTPEYSRAKRFRELGRPPQPKCAHIKDRYGAGRGERCQNAAMLDRDYCYQHDPGVAIERAAHLAKMRAARDERRMAA